jgi:uncharacterized DUF497 family protein
LTEEYSLKTPINDIIWLDTVIEKLAWKHGVLPHEVEEVLSGRCRLFKRESGKVEGEDLYNALGRTEAGRYLSIFFCEETRKQGIDSNSERHESARTKKI